MSNDKATLTKRLDRLAEVLTGTTNFSKYAHTVYEANAELDRQAAQIAMLREALNAFVSPQLSMQTPTRKLALAALAATSTQADVAAWEQQRRSDVLDEAIRECNEVNAVYAKAGNLHPENSETRERVWAQARAAEQCAGNIRALKDTKP
jgi:hypothetical protein